MPPARKSRPPQLERILRQEAGYGCCACGHPILQYHHIVPYTDDDPHYRPGDMMILCPNCHDKATQGVMKEDEQRRLKGRPSNIEHGHAAGQLVIDSERPEINIGNSVGMIGAGPLIEVDGEPLLSLALSPDNSLLLSVSLYDEDDELVARVAENEWETEDPLPWDLAFKYRHLTIRSAPRKITLAIDARQDPITLRGKLWRHGMPVDLGADGIGLPRGSSISGLSLDGFCIRMTSGESGFQMGGQRRLPIRTRQHRLGRNDLCWCGSGLKFKRCHGA